MSQKKSERRVESAGGVPPAGGIRRKRVKRIRPVPLVGLVVIEQILLQYPAGKSTFYKEIREGAFPCQRMRKGRSVFRGAVEIRQYLKSFGAMIEVPCEDQVGGE